MPILFTNEVTEKNIHKFSKREITMVSDVVVTEEPLEIKIRFFQKEKWVTKRLAVTMRTPEKEEDLAVGFLFTEGILGNYAAVERIERIEKNVLLIHFIKKAKVELESVERNFYATSSCGICGKASIDKLEKVSCFFPQKNLPKLEGATILKLPQLLRNSQSVFEQTGGIHAAALFSPEGKLLAQTEDVGRHNAVDKLIGHCLRKGAIPLRNHILMLSGRVGFELVQKAMMAGIPIIAAVGAPSSLAIDLAEESGITLIGFLRGEQFNIYCGRERISYGN